MVVCVLVLHTALGARGRQLSVHGGLGTGLLVRGGDWSSSGALPSLRMPGGWAVHGGLSSSTMRCS
jgi:hypothetical protein